MTPGNIDGGSEDLLFDAGATSGAKVPPRAPPLPQLRGRGGGVRCGAGRRGRPQAHLEQESWRRRSSRTGRLHQGAPAAVAVGSLPPTPPTVPGSSDTERGGAAHLEESLLPWAFRPAPAFFLGAMSDNDGVLLPGLSPSSLICSATPRSEVLHLLRLRDEFPGTDQQGDGRRDARRRGEGPPGGTPSCRRRGGARLGRVGKRVPHTRGVGNSRSAVWLYPIGAPIKSAGIAAPTARSPRLLPVRPSGPHDPVASAWKRCAGSGR